MRTIWLLGIALGFFIGGFALAAGVLALLVAIPGLVWALRSRASEAAVSGLLLGGGLGQIVLVGLAQMRCTNVSGPNFGLFCTPPDLTPYLFEAFALIVIGLVVAADTVRRRVSRTKSTPR